MVSYQFDVNDELWNDWKDTVPRSKSLHERLTELIEADRDGRVLDSQPATKPTPEPTETESTPVEVPGESNIDVDPDVWTAVEAVAESWDDTPERLEQRKRAAAAVLQHAVETGDYIGKRDAVENFRDSHPVEGQNERTWWRQNARRVLREYGEYSNGKHGYKVDSI